MARSDAEKDAIFSKWKDLVNMTEKELTKWSKDPDRLEASLNREEAGKIQSGYDSLHRIKRRVSKNQSDWSDEDYDNASQENGFNQRMLGNNPGEPVADTGMSKWEISLRNWGHDPSKTTSPANAKWKSWKKRHQLKTASLSLIARRVAAKNVNTLSRDVIKKINKDLAKAGMDGNKYFPKPGGAWGKVFEVLGDYGLTSDDLPQFYGNTGNLRMSIRWINDEGSEIDNTMLMFSWHLLSSNYEVIVYLS